MNCGIFRTPSSWTSSARLAATFLSPRWPTVVGRRGLPCCAAVFLDSISTETSLSISRPHHNHHNHHRRLGSKGCTTVATLNFPSVPDPSGWPRCDGCTRRSCRRHASARRRRERRLRSWAKHERLSVAMALAEKLSHSANRTVLPKEEEVVQHYALRGQKPARAGPGTQYFSLGDESVLEPLGEPQLQARVQRHYLEDTSNVCPFLQILALPVPQMVDTVLEFFRLLEFPVAEYPRSPRHRVLLGRFSVNRRWRNSWSQCRRCCPMPCSSSGMWSKLLTFQFLVMVVVEVFKVFTQEVARCSVLRRRTLTFQFLVVVPVEVFKVFSRTWFRTACCGTEPWSWCSWWSSWFTTELVSANCGTDRRHSCPWSWCLSRFPPGTGFNSVFWS